MEPDRPARLTLPPWAAGFTALLLFASASRLAAPALRTLTGWSSAVLDQAMLKTVLLVFVLAIMLWDGRPLRDFGLRPARAGARTVATALAATALGIVATLIVAITPASGMSQLRDFSLLDLVLWVWIWSSLSEEMLCRGLVQTWTKPGRHRFAGLSTPVVTSALTFGALHLTLILNGADAWTVVLIVTSTTLLGVLCGLARERSGSIWPAFVVHCAFNVGGFVGGLVALALGLLQI